MIVGDLSLHARLLEMRAKRRKQRAIKKQFPDTNEGSMPVEETFRTLERSAILAAPSSGDKFLQVSGLLFRYETN